MLDPKEYVKVETPNTVINGVDIPKLAKVMDEAPKRGGAARRNFFASSGLTADEQAVGLKAMRLFDEALSKGYSKQSISKAVMRCIQNEAIRIAG